MGAKVSYTVIGWICSVQCCDTKTCWKFLGQMSQPSGGDSRGPSDCQSSPTGWPWPRQCTPSTAELPKQGGLNWASAWLNPAALIITFLIILWDNTAYCSSFVFFSRHLFFSGSFFIFFPSTFPSGSKFWFLSGEPTFHFSFLSAKIISN